MGRGRAKAKQTKVARELKYSSQGTDFDALQRELSGGDHGPVDGPPARASADSDELDELDEYDDYADWAAGHKH